jgi:hypothetical protein
MITDLQTMTFGIEIETCIPHAALQQAGWTVGSYHRGAEIPGFAGWKAMTDSSIVARYPSTGVEVVSPVLSGAEGLEQVRRMVTQLRTMGAKVNQSTGFHVHIGFNGSPAALRRLICLVSHHERAFFASTGTHQRENNTFCGSIKMSHRALADMRTESDLINAHMSRYHVLNLTNLQSVLSGRGGHRTVEFRVFAGTLNITKIVTYVQLCLGSVQRALDTTETMTWDAVVTEKQKIKADARPGTFAIGRLIHQLNWYENHHRPAFGVFDRSTLPTMTKMLRKMAKKYDGIATTGADE